ncbi:MAG: hypothetical protein K0R21_1042 [Anaerocolumna sp.]|jgi:transcriptional regulator with XRE-family HTH domain|nr:hypothetical protein [Anaerocolumna sp.]
MMAKYKSTMRDIAKECGVSVATVSYVLNHSQEEKISHDTRLKVMETATRLHYTPNKKTKFALERQSNLIGIIINLKESNTSGKKMIFYDLAAELSDQMSHIGFETILIATKELKNDVNVITKHRLDALFIIDADTKTIARFTKDYYVPILFLDCEINNSLFCRIYPDYEDIISNAKRMLNTEYPFLIMEDVYNQPLRQQVIEWFRPPDIFIHTETSNLEQFLHSHQNGKGIVIGDILGMQVERHFPKDDLVVISSLGNTNLLPPDMKRINVRNKTKASVASKVLSDMLSLDYEAVNDNCILLKMEDC